MEPLGEPDGHAQSSKQTTERIQALGEISKKIPQMLQHAGQSVNILTKSADTSGLSVNHSEDNREGDGDALARNGVALRRAEFKEHITAFYTLLHEISTKLKDETNALVDAGLIPAEAPKKGILGQDITNSGMGNLDIGYLNSRTRDMGLVKQAELVKEAKAMLEMYVKKTKEKGQEEEEAMDES